MSYSRGYSFMSQELHKNTWLMPESVMGLNSDSARVKDQKDLSGVQQKPIDYSQGSVPLDPIEEKILYHMDDNVWDSSFARNRLEIGSRGFSWSALMQSALEDDTGNLDANSYNQTSNIHCFGSSLDNVCQNSFGMLQHVHSQGHGDRSFLPDSSYFVLGQISSEMNQNFVVEMPVQKHADMQVMCNSSLASQPRGVFARSYDLCANAQNVQPQLEGVNGTMIQQNPPKVYNAPTDAFSEEIFTSFSYIPKSTYNFQQNSAVLQQKQRDNLIMGNLRTDYVPDVQGIASAEKGRPHEQSSSTKMPTATEPGIILNLKQVASAEYNTPSYLAEKREDQTRNILCLHPLSQTPNRVATVGETQSNIVDVMTVQSGQLSIGKSSDNLHMQNYTEKLDITTLHSNSGLSESGMQYLGNMKQSMAALRPKKRRFTGYWQWPWHKEVMQGYAGHHSISMSEQEWVRATNRLFEQVEDNVGIVKPMPPSKRRIISTTHLMQKLFRPAPPFTFLGNSAIHHESIVYFVCRIALGDACSLACYKQENLSPDLCKSKTISKKIETFSTAAHQQYSEIFEAIIKKIQKLESDFQRLEKTTSIIDTRVEIQDQERFSVVNRFAKFYSRAQADSPVRASSSAAMSISVPQRYVIALSLPTTLPEEVRCLSL